ncbi:MAG TPA: prephenate dehydratase [Pyrinomonadaceae bacterium]|nr:prephenate dehydratase [Pyrinomonadaceae bacterium]
MRVAFQGERGAFSEEAAIKLLGEEIQLVPRPTFEMLFSAVGEGIADRALAPMENSLAGSVVRSYDLLLESELLIEAEVIIPISHTLISCHGAMLDSVSVVESHPVALAQCERFFAAHPCIERIATDDTAASVRRVVERGDPARAAIASRRAAALYGGQILAEHLEDDAENYTRFVLLAPLPVVTDDADKISLAIQLKHQPGALYHALEPFARRGINLLKIESRPVKGRPWQYHIYLDLKAPARNNETDDALSELRSHAESVRPLGHYTSARA